MQFQVPVITYLTIPTGAGSGQTRIVLDGTTGILSLINANGDTIELAAFDPDDNTHNTPTVEAFLHGLTGVVKLYAYDGGDGGPSWRLDSANHVSSIDGSTIINNTARVQPSGTLFGASRRSDGLAFGGNLQTTDSGAALLWTDEVTTRTVNANSSGITVSEPIKLSTGSGWTDIPMSNSWVNRSGFYAFQVKKLATDNLIAIVGSIINGTTTNGTTVGTLPAGYRPAGELFIPVLTNTGELMGFDVKTTGAINIFRPSTLSAFTTIHCNATFPLTGPTVTP